MNAATLPSKTGQAFTFVTTLFFAWGFATSLIDPLVAAVRRVFDLTMAEALLTASAWFLAYGFVSLPAAWLLAKLGYSRAIVLALCVMVTGTVIVPLATVADSYAFILVSLFVIASGITVLQVAANPLIAVLGESRLSHFRLSLSQGFNALGTVLGPYIGSHLLLTGGIFAAGAAVTAPTRGESLRSIDLAFLGMGAFFAALAGFIWLSRRTIDAAIAPQVEDIVSPLAALHSRWAVLGAAAIFLYVGAEVTIGGVLTNFLASEAILDRPLEEAGKLVSFYWAGAMIGRFVGSAALTRVPAGIVLGVCTLAASFLCFLVTQTTGVTAAYAAISIGLFNSIMFPVIFTMTLERSSAPTSATSGLLCMAIVGGAVLPQIAGQLADAWGTITVAFFVPLAAYILLTAFAFLAAREPPIVGKAINGAVGH